MGKTAESFRDIVLDRYKLYFPSLKKLAECCGIGSQTVYNIVGVKRKKGTGLLLYGYSAAEIVCQKLEIDLSEIPDEVVAAKTEREKVALGEEPISGNYREKLSYAFRLARLKQKLSIKEIMARTGLTDPTIQAALWGNSMTAGTALALCRVFRIRREQLPVELIDPADSDALLLAAFIEFCELAVYCGITTSEQLLNSPLGPRFKRILTIVSREQEEHARELLQSVDARNRELERQLGDALKTIEMQKQALEAAGRESTKLRIRASMSAQPVRAGV